MSKKRLRPRRAVEALAMSVVQAGRALGIGRNSAYEAVKRKEIPSKRVGGRIIVPVDALKRKLNDSV